MATKAIGSALLVLAACGGGSEQQSPGDASEAPPPSTVAADDGEALYQQRCVSCHQLDGQGLPGTFPPLAGSEWALAANVAAPIRAVMHGVDGPITVKGTAYSGVMPAYGVGVEMSDAELAAVLTYVRRSWGNQASAITADDVARVRAAPRARTGPVNAEELKALMQP